MSRRRSVEPDAEGRIQAIRTLDGPRIPAAHVVGVYLSYLPAAHRHVLSVLAIDPENHTIRWRAIQEGRGEIRPLKALQELTEQLEGSRQASSPRGDRP